MRICAPIESPRLDEISTVKYIAEYIAVRLIALRRSKGLRQADLAPVLGVQGGQISKYEKADSLITLDNLYKVAAFYDIPVSDLLPPLCSDSVAPEVGSPRGGFAEARTGFEYANASPTTQSGELATAFLSIKNPQIRAALLEHAKALAAAKV